MQAHREQTDDQIRGGFSISNPVLTAYEASHV